ncbi:hypothetical protein [Lysobacter gummosus]|uniref:hypothetical protein n=1 Tax=Lysobacter gummosus TaxID=262324 RepID=UPI003627A834
MGLSRSPLQGAGAVDARRRSALSRAGIGVARVAASSSSPSSFAGAAAPGPGLSTVATIGYR